MRTTFSPRAEIDYYPITAAFPIMHTSYDLIRWLRTLSTESHEVMIPRSTTIHFQTAARTGEAARIMHGEQERKREGESNHNRGALRKIRAVGDTDLSARSNLETRLRNEARSATHSLRSRADARACGSPGSSEHVGVFTLAWPLARRLAKLGST